MAKKKETISFPYKSIDAVAALAVEEKKLFFSYELRRELNLTISGMRLRYSVSGFFPIFEKSKPETKFDISGMISHFGLRNPDGDRSYVLWKWWSLMLVKKLSSELLTPVPNPAGSCQQWWKLEMLKRLTSSGFNVSKRTAFLRVYSFCTKWF